MLSHASLLGGFWAQALKIIVHVINRSPIKNLDGGVLKRHGVARCPFTITCTYLGKRHSHMC